MKSNDLIHRTWVHSDRFVPRRFIQPLQGFLAREAASGIVLFAAAVAALWWANSSFSDSYQSLFDTEFGLEVGAFHLSETLGHVINDGLMAIFFFVVGLEIKRELVVGELRDRRQAMLPIIAAVGGMVFPALVYLMFASTAARSGWAIPMATDIAFSIGVLALLGRRVPPGAKLLLLALAIVDDLGGILVIAVFYTAEIQISFLTIGLLGLVVVGVASRVGIRSHVFYVPMAIAVWYCFLESGVHATIAGVALGFLTPARPMYSKEEFDTKSREILDLFPVGGSELEDQQQTDFEALTLSELAREAVAPLIRNEHRLGAWSSFVIIPVFALANAGVDFRGVGIFEALSSPVALGTAFGLVVGKTLGITLFAWLAVRSGLARLPDNMNWRHVTGVAATAGIGFTVAIFISSLAFDDALITDQAKAGIFAGSIVAGLLGAIILATGRPREE